MIQRIVTAAVLSAGVAVFFSPSFAQTATGTTGGVSTGTGSSSTIGTTTSPAPQGGSMTTSPSGSMSSSGTMSGSQSGSMTTTQGGAGVSGSQSGTMGTNTMGTNTMGATGGANTRMPTGAQANAQYNVNQAQGPRRAGRVNDAAERQITECLNNAAAQRQTFDSCRR